MAERSSQVDGLRLRLVDSMSVKNASTIRTTALEDRWTIRYFTNPKSSLMAACALSKVALGEVRGLDTLYILAITAENPTQLANSVGAIAAASHITPLIETYNHNPYDLSSVRTKQAKAVRDFKGLLGEKPGGSFQGEKFSEEIKVRADDIGAARTNEIITDLARRVNSPNPDQRLLSVLTESFFLTALDTGKRPLVDNIRDRLSGAFLTDSSPIFEATERLLALHPEYFELIFGRQASFWREFRHDLFPNLTVTAERIIAEGGTSGSKTDRQVETSIGQLLTSATAIITAKEERKKTEAQDQIRAEQERTRRERVAKERAANPEKYVWLDTKVDFETKWKEFVAGYEKDNGNLNSPLTHFEFVDLFTRGIGILHEAIFDGKSDTEIRAGMETILPKFWPHKELGYVMEDYLNEYELDSDGNPVKITTPGEKVLAQIVYLPERLRPRKLGSAIKLNQIQQSARNRIVRSLSKAAHPDRSYDYSDPKDAASVDNFLRIANEYKNYLK